MTRPFFKKWYSIENSYQQKNLDWWLSRHGELADEQYVITQKIDGTNFSWTINIEADVWASKRNSYIPMDQHYQGADIATLWEQDRDMLLAAVGDIDFSESVRFFGELFGGGIGKKGPDTGGPHQLLYFALMVDGALQPFSLLSVLLPKDKVVPVVGKANGLSEALAFDTGFNTKVGVKENTTCEGVVIQPYSKVYTAGDSVFLLKKKNEQEVGAVKKKLGDPPLVGHLQWAFRRYITDARGRNMFSKEGEIERPNQIGDYIRLVLADAKEDFLKEFGEDVKALDSAQMKKVYNAGLDIMLLLKEYL